MSTGKEMETEIISADQSSRLIWCDLELTGLNLEEDKIIEVACIITEANLDIVATCPRLIIHQPKEILDKMNAWCQETHRKYNWAKKNLPSFRFLSERAEHVEQRPPSCSAIKMLCDCSVELGSQEKEIPKRSDFWKTTGLYDEVLKSTLTIREAEKRLLDFVRQHTEPKNCPLAGNTVYVDRFFLTKHMPTFDQHMHYRIVDVSSVKEMCRRWRPDVYEKAPKKMLLHRAEEDIKESIEELKYYKSVLFDR